jgi:serine/threonine-protein kinase
VQAIAPAALDHIVRRCLEKDRDDRWQSAHDVAGELRWTAEAGSQAGVAAPVIARRRSRERIAWLLAGSMTVAAIAAAALAWRIAAGSSKPSGPRTLRFSEVIGDTRGFYDVYQLEAISPDGRTLAWVSLDEGRAGIRIRNLGELESRRLPGTEGAQQLFFSPDGKWLGFFSAGMMKKVPVGGGAPVAIGNATLPRGATWGEDDSIVFVPFNYAGVERISASGAGREVLTSPDRANGEVSHRWPSLLPGGKTFLYSIGHGSSWDEAKIVAQRFGSKERKVLVEGGSNPRYLPTGHLVYARGESLYAVPFDPGTLEVGGAPVQIVEGVANGAAGMAEYSVSRTGVLVYRAAGTLTDEGGGPVLLDRAGKKIPLGHESLSGRSILGPVLSPGGDRLSGAIGYEIWTFDLRRGTSTRLTSGTRAISPVWSPDGSTIVFGEERGGPWNPYVRRSDGTDPEQLLVGDETSLLPTSWSPDGKFILMERTNQETGGDVMVYSVADRSLKPFLVTEQSEENGVFSPDGRWVAYRSVDSGRNEIYVRPFDGSPGRWQISNEGALFAYWKKLDEIVYQSGSSVMSVHVRTSPTFVADPPRVLFSGPYFLADVTHDGERFLALESGEPQGRDAPLRVVLDWFPEVVEKMSK